MLLSTSMTVISAKKAGLKGQNEANRGGDIFIKGARVHNLKNVDVTIPRNKLIVVTGVSGSGKSSLTIDTLFAEGQRRYAESLAQPPSHCRTLFLRNHRVLHLGQAFLALNLLLK